MEAVDLGIHYNINRGYIQQKLNPMISPWVHSPSSPHPTSKAEEEHKTSANNGETPAQHDLHLLARVHHVVGQDAQPLASTTKAVGRWDGGIDVGECRLTIKSALMLMNMLVNVGETILQVNFMIFWYQVWYDSSFFKCFFCFGTMLEALFNGDVSHIHIYI